MCFEVRLHRSLTGWNKKCWQYQVPVKMWGCHALLVGRQNETATLFGWQFLTKLNTQEQVIEPFQSWVFTQEIWKLTFMQKHTHTCANNSTTRAKKWKQPKDFSTEEWRNKLPCLYNGMLLSKAKEWASGTCKCWVDFKDLRLSEEDHGKGRVLWLLFIIYCSWSDRTQWWRIAPWLPGVKAGRTA